MLSQEVEERLAERLVDRIEEANASILKKIGEAIKEISTLNPSKAYQLSQILKYGGSYEEIAKELAKVSGKNVQDIYKIFDEVAKENKQFAKEFYKYRGIDFIPYEKDIALQNQVRSIATLTANTYLNIARTSMIGLVQDGQFKDLRQAYYDTIDRAIISTIEGKQDFYSSMRETLKELGGNGLVQYENGYKRRLDSVVRMNMLDGIRQLNNETSKRFGEEYDADGIEISVHSNPAPDHADIQGRQFSNEQYEILEAGGIAKDYKGNKYNGADKRHISEYNCYHKIFAIVLGVSNPEYSDKELKKIQEDNEKGFEFGGKHYTNYEGTQLQRRIETEIRRQKDTQILAKASGDMELVGESQSKITKLTHKYNDLCKASGLKPKKQRMSVSGYVRTKVDNIKEKVIEPVIKSKVKLTDAELDEEFYMLSQDLQQKLVRIDNGMFNIEDKEFRNKQLKHLDILTDKYIHNEPGGYRTYINSTLIIDTGRMKETTYGFAEKKLHRITLSNKWYNNKQEFIQKIEKNMDSKWFYDVPKDKRELYILTHEYGHILEYEYIDRKKWLTNLTYNEVDKDLRDIIMTNAMNKLKEKITITEFKNRYWSRYAKSKRDSEWFAETFANYILNNKKDVWTEAFGEWLEGYFNG